MLSPNARAGEVPSPRAWRNTGKLKKRKEKEKKKEEKKDFGDPSFPLDLRSGGLHLVLCLNGISVPDFRHWIARHLAGLFASFLLVCLLNIMNVILHYSLPPQPPPVQSSWVPKSRVFLIFFEIEHKPSKWILRFEFCG